jgi:hypothetical protein
VILGSLKAAGVRDLLWDHSGVGISFSRHSPIWRVGQYFHSPSQKTAGQNIGRVSERGKKLARLASGFVFLLAKHKVYSHLASWRVVIRTPASCDRDCMRQTSGTLKLLNA